MQYVNEDLKAFYTCLEQILLDEFDIFNYPDGRTGYVYHSYVEFLVDCTDTFRWYGIKNITELFDLWSKARTHYTFDGIESYKEEIPPQLNLLTRLVQRITEINFEMNDARWFKIVEPLMKTLYVYNVPEDLLSQVKHDEHVESSINFNALKSILKSNKWMVVMIALQFVPKATIIKCIHGEPDDYYS